MKESDAVERILAAKSLPRQITADDHAGPAVTPIAIHINGPARDLTFLDDTRHARDMLG